MNHDHCFRKFGCVFLNQCFLSRCRSCTKQLCRCINNATVCRLGDADCEYYRVLIRRAYCWAIFKGV
ncbi:MAG: hypothetical protein IT204_15615 [Fimbriimonadaceae bacterium]|nr:hypothetical protein [Fimbriimonadaceae bacterium]